MSSNSINYLFISKVKQNLQEYGPGYCELPTMVENIAVLLRTLSLNVDPAHKRKIPVLCYIYTIFSIASYCYVYVFSMVWFVFIKCIETGDVISALIIFPLGIASEISTVKLIFMYLYQESLRRMIENYLVHHSKGGLNARFTDNLLKSLRRVKKRALIFWIMIMGNGMVYSFKPLLMPGRHQMEDTEFLYGLEPITETPNYEIAYILSFAGVLFTCYATANISGFFIIVIGYIEGQMLSLSEEITSIWDDAQEYYNQNHHHVVAECSGAESEDKMREKDIILNNVKKQLHNIIVYHTTNMSFLNQIEDVFRVAIAIEFLLLTVSLIAELLGGLENTYLAMPFAMAHATMDCITGQKLLDSGDVFLRAVYASNWENFDVRNMKTVLMMLRMTQKGMAVSAGGFAKLDFLCLMAIARLIFSTYTALRTAVNY